MATTQLALDPSNIILPRYQVTTFSHSEGVDFVSYDMIKGMYLPCVDYL